MATCSKKRATSETTDNATVSKEESHIFIRKLVAMAVSNVTYLRGIFPECVYADRQLQGLPLKILRGSESCPAATQVVRWLKGAFEAMQCNYLRKLIFALHNKDAGPNNAIETYTFEFTYAEEKVQTCNLVHAGAAGSETVVQFCKDPKAVLRTALRMMRGTLFLIQSLEPLPGEVDVSMKLLYYDDVTPADYDPPGFLPYPYPTYYFESDPLSMGIGKVSTQYHSVTLECETTNVKVDSNRKPGLIRVCYDTAQAQTSTSQKELSLEDIMSMPVLTLEDEQDKAESSSSDECIPSSQIASASGSNLCRESQKNRTVITPAAPVASHETPEVAGPSHLEEQLCNCPCITTKKYGLLLTCNKCYSWSHAACYGYNKETGLPKIFVCLFCHILKRGVCTDCRLVSAQPDERQEICLYRQTLSVCQGMDYISPSKLCRELSLGRTAVFTLMKFLKSDSIIKRATKGASRGVNQEILKTVILRYFHLKATPTATVTSHHISEIDKITKGIEQIPSTITSTVQTRSLSAENLGQMPFTLTTSRKRKCSQSIAINVSPSKETPARKKTRGSQGSNLAINRS